MSLPTDVFPLIVAQVDTDDYKTLCSLCLTNRFLGWEATRRLYRELEDAPWLASLHCKLLSTLISRPDLAAMVRSYVLPDISRQPCHTEDELYKLIAAEGENSDLDLPEELITILVSKALPLMANLKELAYSDQSEGPEAYALLTSADFQLEKLDWRSGWDGAILGFLKRQRSLKWIKLHPSSSNLRACVIAHPIPRFPWQNLTTLAGKQAVVEAILPFAPGVRNLALHFTDRHENITSIFDVSRDIAKCTGQLTRLTVHNYCTDISLTAFEGAVDNLEYLAVESLLYDNNAQVSTFVSRLKKLKMFVLLSCNGESVESCHALAVDLLRESQSLEQVAMDFRFVGPPNGDADRSRRGYFLLSRGSDEVRRLHWDLREMTRFMLPACEEDAASPGWTNVRPFVLSPSPRRI